MATGTTRMSNSGRTAYYIVFRESDVPNACKDLVAPRVVGITAGGKWGGVCAALRILIARTFKAGIDPRTLQSNIVFGFVKLIFDQRVQDRSFLVMTPRGQYPSRTPTAGSTSSPTAPGPPQASAEWVFSAQRCASLWVSTAVGPLQALEETGKAAATTILANLLPTSPRDTAPTTPQRCAGGTTPQPQ